MLSSGGTYAVKQSHQDIFACEDGISAYVTWLKQYNKKVNWLFRHGY